MDEKKTDMGEVARKTLADRDNQREAEANELQRRLETPIGIEEARASAARIGMREAQLSLAREQVLGHLNEIDQQLAACRCARAELDCRLTVDTGSDAAARMASTDGEGGAK